MPLVVLVLLSLDDVYRCYGPTKSQIGVGFVDSAVGGEQVSIYLKLRIPKIEWEEAEEATLALDNCTWYQYRYIYTNCIHLHYQYIRNRP